jgi:two-component system alkaline phosphatase synthesis response regulator PhoP
VAKVLVIDDEPDVLMLCRVNLEHAGHAVLIAESGEAGLELAMTERPDLIVLDLMMPTMDGFQVLEELAGAAVTRDVPVLILTARTRQDDKVRGWRAGADAYITKPFTPATLVTDVERLEQMTTSERSLHRAESLRRLLGESVA